MPGRISSLVSPRIWNALAFRMVVVFAVVLGLLGVVVTGLVSRALSEEAMDALTARTDRLSVLTAERLAPLLEAGDRESLEPLLRLLAQDEPLAYVQVFARNGALIGAEGPRRFGADDLWWGQSEPGVADALYQVEDPVLGPAGDTLGYVRMAMSLEPVRAQVAGLRTVLLVTAGLTFLVGMVAVIAVTHFATRPVRALARAADRIAEGRLDSRVEVRGPYEVRALARGFNQMGERLRTARDDLAGAKGRIERILDSLPAPVVVFDDDLDCVYLNRAGSHSADLRASVIGRPASEVWAAMGSSKADTVRLVTALEQAGASRSRVSVELEEVREGEERTFLYMANPMRDPEGEDRIVAYRLDISDWREAERALEDSQEKLRQAQKMEAVGRLAGGIAHDFNNILTSIGGFADLLLLEAGDDGDRRADLEQIRAGTDRAARLTRQLLAFGRKQVLQPRILDLNEVLAGLEPMLRRIVPERVCFLTDPDPEATTILADASQVEQVLMNLVVNAVDAMPDGGSLRVSTRGVRDGDGARRARLTVLDTGVGMDPEIREMAFEPFFTTKGPGEGSGLGLATVYGIVAQSGGTVGLLSRPGRGTVVRIEFPAADGPPDELPGDRSDEVEELEGSETILLVEDDDPVRSIATKVLARHGYRVLDAAEPREALEILGRTGWSIDLLLTDVVMPGMSGPELASRVAGTRPDLRILFMSGYSEEPPPLDAAGNAAFLPKPFSATGLARAVRSHLDRSNGSGPPA
jgi:hypothetical protein